MRQFAPLQQRRRWASGIAGLLLAVAGAAACTPATQPPTATATETVSPSDTSSPTHTLTASLSNTATETPSLTPSATATATRTGAPTLTLTPLPATPVNIASPAPTQPATQEAPPALPTPVATVSISVVADAPNSLTVEITYQSPVGAGIFVVASGCDEAIGPCATVTNEGAAVPQGANSEQITLVGSSAGHTTYVGVLLFPNGSNVPAVAQIGYFKWWSGS